MNAARALEKAAANPLQLAIGAALLIGVIYYLGRRTVTDTARAAGGIVSGRNAITEGTSYEGAGILGTVGATVNAGLGGVPERIGSAIGGWFADLTEPNYNPNPRPQAPPTTREQQAREAFWLAPEFRVTPATRN